MRAIFTTISTGSLAASSLFAQAVGEESRSVLEEVTVTAQKREQAIQDVPISITAFSSAALRELGFQSSIDVAAQTPNLSTGQNFGEGNNPIVSIRGITMLDFTEFNESPSAVYIDEFYKANLAALDFQLFDLERVEVLRGPQGMLFGRNTSGGLVQYITVKPAQEKSGFGEITLGSNSQVRFEGAAGGGLSDTLSGRVSVIYSKHDGYVENVGYGNGNDLDTRGIRGQLLFEPTDRLSFLASLQYAKNNANGNPWVHHSTTLDPTTGLAIDAPTDFFGYSGPPLKDRQTTLNRKLYVSTKSTIGLFRIQYDVDAFSFISLTGFEKVDKTQRQDPDASPNDIFQTNTFPKGTEWSQEFCLQGSQERFRWLAGLYLFDYKNEGFQYADVPTFGISPNVNYSVKTDSWALFGQLEYDISDTWSAILGLRYTEEDKKFESINDFYSYPDGAFLFPAQVFTEETVGDLTRQSPNNTNYRVVLNYTPTDNLLVYGSVSTGFKGGTFNLGFFPLPSVEVIPVQPEKLTS